MQLMPTKYLVLPNRNRKCQQPARCVGFRTNTFTSELRATVVGDSTGHKFLATGGIVGSGRFDFM
jgi:hypothetical protein